MLINNKFNISDIVYSVIDRENSCGIVTGLLIEETCVLYRVSWSNGSISFHYNFELTLEKYNG